jgi:uncharacterized membrane protein YqaE (UPF0057 family)
MEPWRVVMALIFTPFAVLDKGCGAFLLVSLLTAAGWIPGVIVALAISYADAQNRIGQERYVDVPARYVNIPVRDDGYEKPKRKGAYVRLSDGDTLEVIDDDGSTALSPDEKRKRDGEDYLE